jgi:hypothetical protein
MAIDQALLTRQRVLAAKIETTTGTPETLANVDGVINVFDAKMDATIPPNEREGQGQGALSWLFPVPGARQGKCSFKSEMVGSGTPGTDPLWLSVLLATCGFQKTTGVWYPQTGCPTTATLGLYQSGRLLCTSGAMGKVTFECQAGNPVMGTYEYEGVWQPPTSQALLAPAYPLVVPPRFATATFTVGGHTYRIGKLTLTIDNTVTMREDASDISGYHAAAITNRKITIKVSPEALPLSTQDWFAAHLADTNAGAIDFTLGSVSGNQIEFHAPNVYLMNPPQLEDGNGIYRDALEFLCVRNSSIGDDEISIEQV